MSNEGTPTLLEEARARMGGEYLKNAKAKTLEVRHSELKPWSDDSAYKGECPACEEGILLVRRDGDTLELLEYDRCIVCAQSVRYLDIDKLRKREAPVSGLYTTDRDIDIQKYVAREIVKKHSRHKASPQLLPAFLFLLDEGEVDWEIGDDDEIWWFAVKPEGVDDEVSSC